MRGVEQLRQGLSVQGGGHGHQAQVLAQGAGCVQAQRERQVAGEAAFVEFVEDHQPGVGQLRVPLQAPQQQALGEYLDTGLRPDPAFEAHLVTDAVADLFAQQRCHAMGRHARGRAARLEHDDLAARQPRGVQQGQRHQGGLARARRCAEHHMIVRQCLGDGRQGGGDRQIWQVHGLNDTGAGWCSA